jgi:small subunit ribosomal protein S10
MRWRREVRLPPLFFSLLFALFFTASCMSPTKKTSADEATPKKAPAKKTTASKKVVSEKKDVAPKTKSATSASEAGKIAGIRIRLSAFDHSVLDEAAMKIIDTATRSGAVVHGPTPLPTKIRKFTVNRSTFVHKDARDQFEMRTHRRLIDLSETTFKTVDSLQNLSLPSGVEIEIRMK